MINSTTSYQSMARTFMDRDLLLVVFGIGCVNPSTSIAENRP